MGTGAGIAPYKNEDAALMGIDPVSLSEFYSYVEAALRTLVCTDEEIESICEDIYVHNNERITVEEYREAKSKPGLCIGPPGIGKTAGIISTLKKFNSPQGEAGSKGIKIGFKKILLGQTIVGEMGGIPVLEEVGGQKIAKRLQDILPDVERDGEYGLLFLDEITTADDRQVRPALGLCDESRSINSYVLPPHWIVMAAGNGPSDANFVQLKEMTASRFARFCISPDYEKDWYPWARNVRNVTPYVLGFLNFMPSAFYFSQAKKEDTDGRDGTTLACPRTWDALSADIKSLPKKPTLDELRILANHHLPKEVTEYFVQFWAMEKGVPIKPKDVLLGNYNPKDNSASAFEVASENLMKIVGEMETEHFYIFLEGLLGGLRKVPCDLLNPKDKYRAAFIKALRNFCIFFKMLNSTFAQDWVVVAFSKLCGEFQNIHLILEGNEIPEFTSIMSEPALHQVANGLMGSM